MQESMGCPSIHNPTDQWFWKSYEIHNSNECPEIDVLRENLELNYLRQESLIGFIVEGMSIVPKYRFRILEVLMSAHLQTETTLAVRMAFVEELLQRLRSTFFQNQLQSHIRLLQRNMSKYSENDKEKEEVLEIESGKLATVVFQE